MRRSQHWLRICKAFFLHDIGRKAMALLLAVSLYFYVSNNTKEILSREISGVNVTLELPPDVVSVSGTTVPVQLKISGSQRILNRLTPESFDCRLPVGGGTIAELQSREVELSPGLFRKPFGVTIEAVMPPRIKLQLDKLDTRMLPVRQVFSAEDRPPAGYVISKVAVMPREVAVTGPASLLSGLKQVQTVPVPIDGTTREGFDFVAELQKLDGVSLSPERVVVQVKIERKPFRERSLSGLPYSLLLAPGQGAVLTAEPAPGAPQTAEVMVRGPDEKLNVLKKKWLRIFADLSDMEKPGEYLLTLDGVFTAPEARELEIIRISPEKLRVIVRPRDASALRK